MLALLGAFLFILVAFGVASETVSLFYLGLAFWAAHFAFPVVLWSYKRKERRP